MKIVRLTAENVKRITAIEITPEGNLVVIGGKNGAGKSSVLDAITYALGGKGTHPPKPVREGEKKATVICELDDLVVQRTITATGGGTLVVTSNDGAKYSSPQGMLDKLVGQLSFDPLGFLHMGREKQVDAVKRVVGLDLDGMEFRRKTLYDKRTEIGREQKRLKGQVESMPHHDDAPEKEVSIAELVKGLEVANEHNQMVRDKEKELNEADTEVDDLNDDLERMLGEVRRTQGRVDETALRRDQLKEELSGIEDVDTAELQDMIAGAGKVNVTVLENRSRAVTVKELDGANASYDNLTKRLRKIDEEKAEALASADFPVDGLGFGVDGLEYQDLPFDQASHAEQLRVSVAMGLAHNPKLRVLLVRDGSLLDDESLKLVATMAAEADAQVWIERVGEGAECQVVIEDGAVRGQE